MGKYIKNFDRNQIALLPKCVEDYVDENSEVRVIDAFVDNLDLNNLKFSNSTPKILGAPSYDPKDLLKILIYCYPKKIRSSRRIQSEIKRNLELMWLVNGITPDFRTISDFRKDNITPITNILKEFNKICLELNIYSRELSSLDGSKFKAVNSKDNNFTRDKLIDRINRLDKKVEEYLDALQTNDKQDESISQSDNIDITTKIKKAKEKVIEYNNYLSKLIDNGENQISLTDKESRLMKCNNNMLVGFNSQMSVDAKSHIIHSVSTINKPNDNGNMCEMGKKAKEAFATQQVEQLADGGYVDQNDIKECLENKIVPILPEGVYTITWDYKKSEITDEIKKGTTCEDVKKCLENGVIPDCYSYLNMKIETREKKVVINKNSIINETSESKLIQKAQEGFFVRNKKLNVVYCPGNNTLQFKRKIKDEDLYIGNSKCLTCKKKCTKYSIREILMSPNEDIKISKAFKTTLKRNYKVSYHKEILLTYIPDKNKYKQRKNVSEHPFGILKRTHDASYFLLKGLNKVQGEIILSVLGYNINRLIKIVGIEVLINYLKIRKTENIIPIFC